MNLEIYQVLDTKIKSLLKILNAEYEINNINKFFVLHNTIIKSNGDIQINLDYEYDNGVDSTVLIIDKDNFKSLDFIYKALSNI